MNKNAALRLMMVGLTAAPVVASALEYQGEASLGVIGSDNLTRAPTQTESATIRTADFGLTLRQQTRTLDVDVVGGLVYRDYGITGIDDDLLPSLNARLQATLSPDRLIWTVTENLGEIAAFSNGGLLPPDRERLSVFSTGPDLKLPVADKYWLTAAARVGRSDFETSPVDATRYMGRVGVARDLASGGTVSVNVRAGQTNFSAATPTYENWSGYVEYVVGNARTEVNAGAGITGVKQGAVSNTGFMLDLRAQHQIDTASLVYADAVYRIADTFEVYQRRQDLEFDVNSVTDVLASGQAVREFSVAAGYGWAGRRTRLSIGADYAKESAVGVGTFPGREYKGVNGTAEFDITPKLAVNAATIWRDESAASTSNGWVGQHQLGVLFKPGKSIALRGGYERYRQSNGQPTDYSENRYFLRVEWRPENPNLLPARPGLEAPRANRVRQAR
jgi:hypothetical protein